LPAGAADVFPGARECLGRAGRGEVAGPEAGNLFSGLARRFGTPLYIYDEETIRGQIRRFRQAFESLFPRVRVLYALKANASLAVVRILKSGGARAEVVSGGELYLARQAEFSGDQIMFTSSSKSPWEIDAAIRAGAVLNLDSFDDLEAASEAAGRLGARATISFRINPGVDPTTLHQINTGITESKFGLHIASGIAFSAFERARRLPNLEIAGAQCHIGSQIASTAGYEETARRMLALLLDLRDKLDLTLRFLDLGGGIAIPYRPGERIMTPEDLARALLPVWGSGVAALGYEPELWLEPGRFLVGPAGFLLMRVNSVKVTPVKTIVNVDAGFNDLIRPVLYGAYYRVFAPGKSGPTSSVDVAGVICETGDILASDRMLPRLCRGDLLLIPDAGAYGFSMASEYNLQPLPAEVLVRSDDRAAVIREREPLEEFLRRQRVPEDLL
jgi:diaminopimelate decarboxylase